MAGPIHSLLLFSNTAICKSKRRYCGSMSMAIINISWCVLLERVKFADETDLTFAIVPLPR